MNPDRISYLPDPVQSHIVSFLPIKDAIRISILSKQWKNICYSLSRLEFDQYDFTNKKDTAADFRDFVDDVVIRHDGSDIQRFSLKTTLDDVFISSCRVSIWISFAILHNVQDVEMRMYNAKLIKLPFCFFTCSTLRILTLASVNIEWPSIVRFPVLKCFFVERLIFEYENTIDKLFSNCTCPMLEDLVIRQCHANVHTLSICNPSLKYLHIFDVSFFNINISASTLRKLDCIRCEPPNICSETLLSLCYACFKIFDSGSYNPTTISSQFNCVSKILMGLRNMESLELNSSFIEFFSRGQDLVLGSLPSSYCSLKYLCLGMFPASIHVQVIKLLLRSYPHLQTLQICVDRESYLWNLATFKKIIDVEDYWKLKELPAGDKLNSLRVVEVRDFGGSESEIELVRYLLENANLLKKMNISYKDNTQQSNGSQMNKSEMLLTFASVAPNVKILLS
ncbi:hypothetical protein AQUCO_00300227v1 [Aquilegia coerulea]|uniref:F-box domain-containing protein n=1 Tax=Aquilegia coerulea TaxID=218851 RepID=A0A2G5EXY3_AQUCA|nr:hypothetical protein AQUCO_00300227v1 [Aquilegia coerulea]